MLIKFSAYSARQSSVFFSFSSVISFKIRINTEESVLVGGSGGLCKYGHILSIESGANVPEVCGFDLYSLSEHSKARTAI